MTKTMLFATLLAISPLAAPLWTDCAVVQAEEAPAQERMVKIGVPDMH